MQESASDNHQDENVTKNSPLSPNRKRKNFWVILLLQIVLVGVYLYSTGGLEVGVPRKDSVEYIALSKAPLHDIIRGYRTPGYPLLIRAVHALGLTITVLPYLNLLLHFLTVVVLYLALLRYGKSFGAALGAASGFLYTILNDSGISQIMTDVPSRTLAALSLALLFWLTTDRRNKLLWGSLALTIFATYMIRPIYVTLVALVPLCGLLYYFLRPGERNENKDTTTTRRRQGWQFGGILVAVTLTPLLLYCGYRRATVGHFGVTRSAGYCMMGITAQLLEPEVIEKEISPKWQPLARKIAAVRQAAGLSGLYKPTGSHGSHIDWNGWLKNFWVNLRASNRAISAYYNIKIVNKYDALPALLDKPASGMDFEIIKAKPEMYALFVFFNARRAAGRLFEFSRVAQYLGALLLIAFLLRTLLFGWRSFLPRSLQAQDPASGHLFPPLALTAILFPLFTLGPTLFLLVPIYRYFYAAGIFFSPFLGLLIWQECRAWRHGLRN